MQTLIFATGNQAKIDQINFIVEYFKFPIKIINGRAQFGDRARYEEVGNSVGEIALNGAKSVAKNIGLPVITEDTDFQVEALGNEPDVRAGEFLKTFGRKGILDRMKDIADRKASISSAVAYASPASESKIFINTLNGQIADSEKYGDFPHWISPTKENHFGGGYNSIFIPQGQSKTLAETSPEESIPWSYRERNFIDVVEWVVKDIFASRHSERSAAE